MSRYDAKGIPGVSRTDTEGIFGKIQYPNWDSTKLGTGAEGYTEVCSNNGTGTNET